MLLDISGRGTLFKNDGMKWSTNRGYSLQCFEPTLVTPNIGENRKIGQSLIILIGICYMQRSGYFTSVTIHYNGQEKSLISDCNPHTRRRLRLSKSEKSFAGESNLGMPPLNWFFLNLYCSLVFGFMLPTFGWKSPWKKSHDSKCKDFSASLLFQNGDGRFSPNRSISGERPIFVGETLGNLAGETNLTISFWSPTINDLVWEMFNSFLVLVWKSQRFKSGQWFAYLFWPTWWMPKVDSENRGIKAGVVSLIMPNSKLVNDRSFYPNDLIFVWCVFFTAILSFLPV